MTQNTSHAVMSRRKSPRLVCAKRDEPRKVLDYYPTPPWTTRALCVNLQPVMAPLSGMTVWEPACGEGHMARPLAEYFGSVLATDIHAYGYGEIRDFLFPFIEEPKPDWIITNPPFVLGKEFALRALSLATEGVALFVRTSFLEGCNRFTTLFQKYRPTYVFQFCERVPLVKGRYDPDAYSATPYCWIVWLTGADSMFTTFRWIPPCRVHLEKPEDSLTHRKVAA